MAENIPVQAHFRRGGRCTRDAATGDITQACHQQDRRCDNGRVVRGRHHDPRADGTGQNRQEGAHFHQSVATDQFILMQVLRQDRVLHRPEQRRVRPHGEQRQQHHPQVVEHEPRRAHQHDRDLAQFDQADQRILGVFLAKLPRQCREQKERQNEQQRTQVDPNRAITVDTQLVEDGEDQRLLEDIVVEGPEGLGDEKRQKPPFSQQTELRLTHRPCTRIAPGSAF